MFQKGELILYGRTGVCEVSDITTPNFRGEEQGRKYYVLKPLYQNCGITTPVDNDKVFMRPILSKQQAEKIIEDMPQISAEAYHNRNLTQLKEHYRSCLDSHECEALVGLTVSLNEKKKQAEQQKKKFGAVDERFMKEAQELLYGELAAALGIERQAVEAYIASKAMVKVSSL